MDIKSRSIKDPDKRVLDRILKLKPEEMGGLTIQSLKIDGIAVTFNTHETILEVPLTTPLKPHDKRIVDIEFEARVPIQIRRSGRHNKEGIMYSMAQWYPKICEYDAEGWHPNQYVGREFYGVWGSFDVSLNTPSSYTIAATGQVAPLKNNSFSDLLRPRQNQKIWRFLASQVHDFVWAADTAYQHDTQIIKHHNDSVVLHFYYKPLNDSDRRSWVQLQQKMVQVYPFIVDLLGKYAYPQFSFIQGGDGGMEYPMATLIKNSNVETAIHEWVHSWFQGMLGNNESEHAWMDEGFTNYYEHILSIAIGGKKQSVLLDEADYYKRFLKNNTLEEPMNTPADHFITNANHLLGTYIKGALLLQQLGYLVGEDVRNAIMKKYVAQYKFKHPTPIQFFKTAEDVSGMQLKWFQKYWVNSSKYIDYGVDNVQKNDTAYFISLVKKGTLPMPLDVRITYTDSTFEDHYIPLDLMLGNKSENQKKIIQPVWKWVQKDYVLLIKNKKDIKEIAIDPSNRMIDINLNNQKFIY